MVRTGKVISIDKRNRSGVIRDDKKQEFCFSQAECKDQMLPQLFSTVSFEHDPDWISIKVAIHVHPEAA